MKIEFEVSTNKIDESTIELAVTIPAQEYDNRFHELMKTAAKSIQIPGFRPGKIPFNLLKQRIGSKIEEDVANELTKEVYPFALEKAEIQPIAYGTIENMVFGIGQNMQFIAKVPILPEFEVKGLEELSTWKYKPEIQEDDVKDALEELRISRAKYIVSDLPAREDSFLECKISRYDENKKLLSEEPTGFDHLPIKNDPLGRNTTAQLIGLVAGDSKWIEVSEEHQHGEEKHVHRYFYQINVTAVKEQILPDLNDDFARSISAAYDSLDELKKAIQENLEATANARAEEGVYKRIVEKLMSSNEFLVSKQLVEEKLRQMLSEFGENASKLSDDFVQKYLEPKAVSEAKWEIILRRLVKNWDIQISDEEVDNEIATYAKQYQQRFDALKEQFIQDGRYQNIRVELAKRAALKKIRDTIKVDERLIPFSEFKKLQEV